jgi:hypothetical protein
MIDFLVQFAIAGVVLAMLVLLIVAQDRRANLRERLLRNGVRRHWWNRTRHGQ